MIIKKSIKKIKINIFFSGINGTKFSEITDPIDKYGHFSRPYGRVNFEFYDPMNE